MKKNIIRSANYCFLLLLSAAILNSCTRTKEKFDLGPAKAKSAKLADTTSGPAGVLDYYNFISQPANGRFGIKCYTTFATQSGTRSTIIGGGFNDNDNNALAGGPVSIGFMTLHDSVKNGGHYYGMDSVVPSILFGQTVTFNINPNTNGAVTGKNASVSLYSPMLLTVISPLDSVYNGRGVIWSVDLANINNNMLIVVEYDPSLAENQALASQFPTFLTNSISAQDNGHHVFTSNDLVGMPVGATLTIKMIRVNYTAVNSMDGTNKYLVYTYNGVDILSKHPIP